MDYSGEDKEIRISGHNSVENQDEQSVVVVGEQRPPQISHQAERFSSLNFMKAAVANAASRSIYRECLKNHAANKGGNVTDGCREFMPCGEEGTMEALKCAACSCHRNFHRREIPHDTENSNALVLHRHHLQLPPSLTSLSLNHRRPATILDAAAHHFPTMVAKSVHMAPAGGTGTVLTDSSSEDLNFKAYQSSPDVAPSPPYVLSKKRFRTKFTQEQKEKMVEFAEKLGWRIPREDDSELQRFCAQVGVKRHVFKVWMHNNKSSSSSSSSSSSKKNNPQEPFIMMSS